MAGGLFLGCDQASRTARIGYAAGAVGVVCLALPNFGIGLPLAFVQGIGLILFRWGLRQARRGAFGWRITLVEGIIQPAVDQGVFFGELVGVAVGDTFRIRSGSRCVLAHTSRLGRGRCECISRPTRGRKRVEGAGPAGVIDTTVATGTPVLTDGVVWR